MKTLIFPYRKGRYDKQIITLIDVVDNKSKYKLNQSYELRFKKKRTKIHIIAELIKLETITWGSVTNQMAEEVIGPIKFRTPIGNQLRKRTPRKGDLMMELLTDHNNKVKNISTRFHYLQFRKIAMNQTITNSIDRGHGDP